ncbi:MAG: cobalamin biosynthesis protein [Opitutales bacterium]|nr:cobalamin biosynthesis protein [Opitutales bacterium]
MEAIFWVFIVELLGLTLFKVVSTMDSMVGFKNERYLKFGWCSVRLDDVRNWIPARLSWLSITIVA